MKKVPNPTSEKKQQYILDSRGSFYSQELEEAESEYFFIGSELVEDYQEVKEKVIANILKDRNRWSQCFEMEFVRELTKTILSEKEDWELLIPERRIKHKSSGMEIDLNLWVWIQKFFFIGEFGYRGFHNGIENDVGASIWGEYDKVRNERLMMIERKISERKSKYKKDHHQSTPPENQQEDQSNQENGSEKQQPNQNPISSLPSENKEPEKPTQGDHQNQTPNQNKDKENKPTNNVPSNLSSSSSDIQKLYNSDKAKTEITNNLNLTTPEQKDQAQELLKLIITAELLIKETKTNSKILSKLLKAKNKNSPFYKLLNKDKRIDQVISKLQEIEKNNEPVAKKQKDNKNFFPIPVIPIVLSFLAIVGIGIIVSKKRKKQKSVA